MPDFLSARFKDDTHVMRWVSIVVMTVFMTVYVTAQFVAFGVLFEVVLGVSFSTGVIVGGIVTIIYTMMGGFLAVSLTDFIQGLLMAFAFFVLPILGIIEIGGFTEMGYQLSDMMGEEFLAPFFGNSALTERQTRFEVLLKIDGKDAQSVTEAIESLVERAGDHMASLFKTITSDNGSEFSALHETLKHVTDVYFARPFASYERGTSENQHKLIRRFIPKGQSISSISDRQIQRIQRWMNDYPRKILGYQTPHERFAKSMQHTTGTKCLV